MAPIIPPSKEPIYVSFANRTPFYARYHDGYRALEYPYAASFMESTRLDSWRFPLYVESWCGFKQRKRRIKQHRSSKTQNKPLFCILRSNSVSLSLVTFLILCFARTMPDLMRISKTDHTMIRELTALPLDNLRFVRQRMKKQQEGLLWRAPNHDRWETPQLQECDSDSIDQLLDGGYGLLG